MFDAGSLAVLGTWRMSKGVYVFDKDFSTALDRSSHRDIPASLFRRLPERAVYIPMEVASLMMHGFFASLNETEGGIFLILSIDSANPVIWPIPCIDKLRVSAVTHYIRLMIEETDAEQASKDSFERQLAQLPSILSRVLYLCADDPDIEGKAAATQVIKSRRGTRVIPPQEVNRWEVGLRLGAVFRQYAEHCAGENDEDTHGAATRARPRPHLRRAHWHTYMTGEQRSIPRIRWINPVMVNTNDPSDLVTTIRPVDEWDEDD